MLILGGTGAMGVPVVQILADRGHNVDVTTRSKRDDRPGVHYVMGDAHNLRFIQDVLNAGYNAIVDFMIYTPHEFENRVDLYLNSTNQYVFLSSARVYSDSHGEPITESTPRLLDVTEDKEYLATNEYALAKAREEDILIASGRSNYTIVRPYITYYDERLQLGVFEKEVWLQRVLDGKKIVMSREIGERYTTVTYGYDVSLRIANLLGQSTALGEIFHITTNRSIQWKQVADIYMKVLGEYLGKRPQIIWTDKPNALMEQYVHYQIYYDWMYNRHFDSKKIQDITMENQPFIEPEEGLRKCLENFLKDNKHFSQRDWKLEAVMDRISGDYSNILKIFGTKNKLKYLVYRYFRKYKV